MKKYTQAKLRFNAWNTVYQAWRKRKLTAAVAATLVALGALPSAVLAGPSGAVFIKGNGVVTTVGSGTTVDINAADTTRARASALIDWKGGYNVGASESVHYENKLPTAVPLSVYNVDNTGSVSQIDGTITATKGAGAISLHLINPTGVAIGATANIDVGGGFTAIAGQAKTESCASGTCVPIVYADGSQVEVDLTLGSINVDLASTIKVGGSWDYAEMNAASASSTLHFTTVGGYTTLPFGKASGGTLMDGVFQFQGLVPTGDGSGNLLHWQARNTVVSSSKYYLPAETELTLDNATINGGVSMTWAGKAGNANLTNVAVTDTATRNGLLRIESITANPDASMRVDGLVLDSGRGFGARLDVSGYVAYLDALSATGAAGALNKTTVSDSQVRGNMSAQGTMDLTASSRATVLPALPGSGFERAADDRLAIDLGSDVNFTLAPTIGSTAYNVANVDITGGKTVTIANATVPPSTGAWPGYGVLNINAVNITNAGDVSIKSGASGLAVSNSTMTGTGALELNSKGAVYSDRSYGGAITADSLVATFDNGIKVDAMEELTVRGSSLTTATGNVALGNQYRYVKVVDTNIASDSGNVAISGPLGRLDVSNVNIQTGGDVAISAMGLVSTAQGELTLACNASNVCNFIGADQKGQVHLADNLVITAKDVSVFGDNVSIKDAVITSSGDTSLRAMNQLQIAGRLDLTSTSTDANASMEMGGNVVKFDKLGGTGDEYFVLVKSDAADLKLEGHAGLKVDGLVYETQTGAFAARSESGDVRMDTNMVIVAGGVDIFARSGQVDLANTGLHTSGAGNLTVQAGQDVTLGLSSLTGQATVSVTSASGDIRMNGSQVFGEATSKTAASSVSISAVNGTVDMVDSSVTWTPTYYARGDDGQYLAQEGDGTVRISGMASNTTLTTKNGSGVFGDKALAVIGTANDDGTHTNVWTGDVEPMKTTAPSPMAKVDITALAVNLDASTVLAGKRPANPILKAALL